MSGLPRTRLPPAYSETPITLVTQEARKPVTAILYHSGRYVEYDDIAYAFVIAAEKLRREQWRLTIGRLPEKQPDRYWTAMELEFFNRTYENGSEPVEYFVIVCDGLIQGMRLVGPSKPANLSANGRLLFGAFMATAPWNRFGYQHHDGDRTQSLRGVGTELTRAAIELSKECGLGGRLAVRAMGNSRKFFKRIGMQRVDRAKVKDDEFPGTAWWEFSDDGVAEFLRKHPPIGAEL